VVFVARAEGTPRGGDDAKVARAFRPNQLPEDVAFDHRRIIHDYLTHKY
jgi:8-oxo-dGTP diphosphatase